MDIKGGITRIIDYKTGKISDSVNSLDALFEDDRDKELDGWLQTLLYCEAYLAEMPEAVVIPAVYKLKKTPGDRCSWLTTTRSVPLMINVPLSVISGIVPK